MANSFEEGQGRDVRLGEDAAYEEANMVRVTAEGTTAEDYDKALSVVEQLQTAAEDESTL